MKFITKLERKFGKYSIPNLTLILIIGFILGFLIAVIEPSAISVISLDPERILHGEVWRLVTWVLMPPNGVSIFIILTLMFYWFVGRTLENVWGEFRYNLYIISGIVFTDIGVILSYLVFLLTGHSEIASIYSYSGGGMFGVSSYFLCMSMVLAYAVLFPEQEFITFFMFIPVRIKAKLLGYLDVAILIYYVATYSIAHYIPGVITVIMSVLNFILFYFLYKGVGTVSLKHKKRKRNYQKNVRETQILTRHKCAICGQTEEDNPNLEFRYCSRCKGSYEYCSNHLVTHEHKK